MYSQHATMAPQKPETFMLSTEAQQALPHDAQVALQQVDNCTSFFFIALAQSTVCLDIFLCDWLFVIDSLVLLQ